MSYLMNLHIGWWGILTGFLYGGLLGLFFYQENWQGGYISWKRRMLRLGHISFFGIGFINLFFFFTCIYLNTSKEGIPSQLLAISTFLMPLICTLSAFWPRFRHFFFLPVMCLILATTLFILNEFIV